MRVWLITLKKLEQFAQRGDYLRYVLRLKDDNERSYHKIDNCTLQCHLSIEADTSADWEDEQRYVEGLCNEVV